MRIFKLVLNFALLACVASVAGTASASSACNMRADTGRFADSNPDIPRVAKHKASLSKSGGPRNVMKSKGKK